MTEIVCNSSPISQKGGVAVLCPVAVLGTFPYRPMNIHARILHGILGGPKLDDSTISDAAGGLLNSYRPMFFL